MTAPDTNLEKQAKRHSPALLGISAVLAFVVALVFLGSIWIAQDPPVIEDEVPQGVGATQDQ